MTEAGFAWRALNALNTHGSNAISKAYQLAVVILNMPTLDQEVVLLMIAILRSHRL